MTSISKSLYCAGALIALAGANAVGVIADKDAAALFGVIPALWIAMGGLGRTCQLKAAL